MSEMEIKEMTESIEEKQPQPQEKETKRDEVKEITTGEAQRYIEQKIQEEATVKNEAPATTVETVEQSKEVEKNVQNIETSFEEERDNFIKKLKKEGIDTTTFENGYADIAKAIDSDKHLIIKSIKPRKTQMNYKLIEVMEDGTSDELENNKTILKPSDVQLGTSKVDDILMGMQGYYGDEIGRIKENMSQIAKFRLLKPIVADSDVLNGEQIVKELKSWFKSHMSDQRVASFVVDDFYHVALVKRGDKTPYKIFNEVMQEIAPANKTSAIKDWLYENNMMVHDSNSVCRDTQKTLSATIIEQIDSTGDKCISFNFEEEYREKYYEEYIKNLEALRLNSKNDTEEVK